MKMVHSYTFKILQSAWRRKMTIFSIVFIFLLLAIGLEYNRSGNFISSNNKPMKLITKAHEEDSNENKISKNDVKFLETNPQYNNNKDMENLYQKELGKVDDHDELFQKDLKPYFGQKYFNNKLIKPYIPNKRLVHFDLKGAPPKVSYFKRLFPLLRTLGATGVLMEYEDMFPFTGNLIDIAAGNAYTKRDIEEILGAARDSKLEVIPLVQTFGHVEFILKYKNFAHLREIPDSPQAFCPSRNQSLEVIREVMTQIMDMHPDAQYLHVGCDEVFQMGECEKCREIVRETLFLQHVKNVAGIVNQQWPKLTIIVWDDMLRHIPERTLEEFKIGQLVQPMVWVYVEQIYHFVQMQVWEKYAAIFPTVWAASAYKGAFGETLFIPNAKRHLTNNLRWLELMEEQSTNFKSGFEGIVLTGWQRYDHFAVLCELLPAALPSLALSLAAITNGYFNDTLKSTLLSSLSCPQYQTQSSSKPFISLDSDPYLWDRFSRCLFPGSPFFKLTYQLDSVETEVNEYINSVKKFKGWMTDYNVRYNYSLPLRIDELMTEFPRVYHTVTSLARNANDAMNDIYDIYTITEWVEQRIYPYIKLLEDIQDQSKALKHRKVWQKRPLPPLAKLKRYGIPID